MFVFAFRLTPDVVTDDLLSDADVASAAVTSQSFVVDNSAINERATDSTEVAGLTHDAICDGSGDNFPVVSNASVLSFM
jgi:hypothetical protein